MNNRSPSYPPPPGRPSRFRLFRYLGRWKQAFYRGPEDLGMLIPRSRDYQSPTVTLTYWVFALVFRHFTFGGRILFMTACLILPFSMVSLQMPVYLLPFSILAIFTVNVLFGFLLRPRIEFRRQLPVRLACGGSGRALYNLTNPCTRPFYDLRVDMLPWPRELRWTPGPVYLDRLGSGETVVAEALFTAQRRGVYRVPSMRLTSDFPFHLWCWGQTSAEGPDTIIVHPRFSPLRTLQLPVSDHLEESGGWGAPVPGAGQDFLGCREFRDGDSTRHLHWRSCARVGYPVIKEFQDSFQFQALVVLDNWRPSLIRHFRRRGVKPDSRLEAGVVLAAAIADGLQKRHASVRLLVPDGARSGEEQPVTGSNSLAVFDSLAAVQPHVADGFVALGERIQGIPLHGGGVWMVLMDWNSPRRELVEWLREENIPARILLVCDDAAVPPPEPPPGVRLVRVADIVEGRCLDV